MKLPSDTSIQSHQLTALGQCDAHISFMAEYSRQFAFVSSVLAGFAFAFYGTLLVAAREHRAGEWAAFFAVAASVAFLPVTLGMTFNAVRTANQPKELSISAAAAESANRTALDVVSLRGGLSVSEFRHQRLDAFARFRHRHYQFISAWCACCLRCTQAVSVCDAHAITKSQKEPNMTKTKTSIRFKAKLLRPAMEPGRPRADQHAKTDWTFLILPKNASAKLPSRGLTPIEGTINAFPFKRWSNQTARRATGSRWSGS